MIKHIVSIFLLAGAPVLVQAQEGAGFPEWPLIPRHSNNGLTNAVSQQLLNFKPAFLLSPVSVPTIAAISGQTSTDFGPSAPAYDRCGNLAFYVNHTGTFLPTSGAGLKIVAPDGTEKTSSANRMDCSPLDIEVQVFRMSVDSVDKWMIVYNRNFDPSSGSLAKARYTEVLYSIVKFSAGSLVYEQKDQPINSSVTRYYDYGKALSIEYEVSINEGFEYQKRRYLYLERGNGANNVQDPGNSTTSYIDQYTITPSGILLVSSAPRVNTYTVAKGFSASSDLATPLELNETNGEIRLAMIMCYNGTAGSTSSVGSRIFYARYNNHENFPTVTSAETIQCADLALVPSDNTADTYNLSYHTSGWGGTYKAPKNFINATRALQTYISNFHRGLRNIEFSPNGRFIYVSGGGFSAANTSCITFLGQIDLGQQVSVNSTTQYLLRIKVQEVSGFSLGSNDYTNYGKGASYTAITDASYINFKGLNVLEKAPNAKVYFNKLNARTFFCLNDPDQVFTNIDFLPIDVLNGYAGNLHLASDASYGTSNSINTMLPDAVDQDNYTAELAGCNTELPCANCIGSFAPQGNGVYQLSAWVSDASYSSSMTTFTDPQIYIDYVPTSGSTTTAGPFTASGLIIDGWQKTDAQFTVPAGTASVTIRLECASGDCYFDDIRIFPFDGSMKSYVYDPVTLRLAAELDERNYGTFYEYDEEGKLTRIKKETERGIMTIQESKTAVKKN